MAIRSILRRKTLFSTLVRDLPLERVLSLDDNVKEDQDDNDLAKAEPIGSPGSLLCHSESDGAGQSDPAGPQDAGAETEKKAGVSRIDLRWCLQTRSRLW